MEPKYFVENRYSFVVDGALIFRNTSYEVDTPETAFERSIQSALAQANRLLMAGKFGSALDKYRHLRGLISATLNPKVSVANGALLDWATLNRAELVDPLVFRSVDILKKTPITESTIPSKFRGDVVLPDNAARQFAVFEEIGVRDRLTRAAVLVEDAENLTLSKNFVGALDVLQAALRVTDTPELQGAIQHDIAILQERTGSRDQAIRTIALAKRSFETAKDLESQVAVLTAQAGIQARGGTADAANASLKLADELRKRNNLFSVVGDDTRRGVAVRQPGVESVSLTSAGPGFGVRPDGVLLARPVVEPQRVVFASSAVRQNVEQLEAEPVRLMAGAAFAGRQTQKQLTILDSKNTPQRVRLDQNGAQNMAAFYETLKVTQDTGLLMAYFGDYTTTVAYLTHIYFWVIPMAIGDCHAALGSYAKAESEYLSTVNYKYLNLVVESVNLWVRLAELYNDWGDRLYREAGNVVAQFAAAKQKYELVLRLNNTINVASPLYQSQKFETMRTRANAAIQALFVTRTPTAENPRVAMSLMRARMQLTKIANNLNFIGLGVHIPPFSFEHLQNLARYFTQHASQVEQTYIQFQSTGENEELREQQMAQQVDIAAASVELERRGLDEAAEGVAVAQANLNATEVQRQNAVQASNDFAAVRWELLELDSIQAWSSAAAVDEDDEVQQTISGFTYFSASSQDRSDVLFDLAKQRTRISHDLEANRLQREINAANAYKAVAQAQVQQAQARVAVAQQRVAIAQMQEQHAHENLQFLEGREFSSAMWYNLAREARRVAQRYLDMAIEVATLMEKAYEAETGRDLRKIKFEYGLNHLNGLLGAEALLLDIDFFSLDFVRTKSKKAQMKQTISMADQFPMAFDRLVRTGRTFFETTLAQFDRRYPGFYLQKVKQAEVVFVGLTGAEGVHGTLRNIGLSQFRSKSGAVVNQTYPADVMPLSEYNVRQDAIVFQLDGRELRLFENNGIATMWQLDLPVSSNTFNLRQILDIHLVLYYDGFFDPGLEQQILAALPASGKASRGMSMRMYAPDELFFLRSQGTAELRITPDLFPANQTNQKLTSYLIRAHGTNVAGLRVRVAFGNLGATHTFQLNADGAAAGTAFPAPVGKTLFDTWTFTISPADNPGFDLRGLNDLSVFVEYSFDYRK